MSCMSAAKVSNSSIVHANQKCNRRQINPTTAERYGTVCTQRNPIWEMWDGPWARQVTLGVEDEGVAMPPLSGDELVGDFCGERRPVHGINRSNT
jgi:hypothetical protein